MDNFDNLCQLEDVAAYLDGELTADGLERFEQHVKACATCRNELRAQRQLLCTLDVAFNDSRTFDLPKNFARVVTASAENDLSMIRHGRERKRALQLCVVLGLVSFGLLGVRPGQSCLSRCVQAFAPRGFCSTCFFKPCQMWPRRLRFWCACWAAHNLHRSSCWSSVLSPHFSFCLCSSLDTAARKSLNRSRSVQ